MLRRIFWWAVVPGVGIFLGLAVTSLVLLRPAHIKRIVESGLSARLNLDASIGEVSLSLRPRPRLSGTGLELRLPNRPDSPPFISISRFTVDVGLLSAIRKHVNTLHADGLKIAVPPGDSRDALPGNGPPANASDVSDIIVDHFITHDAELTFVPRKAGHSPLAFAIHDLSVDDVGFGRTMPFTARLTNPVPTGLVSATGTIGPWRPDEATRTPVAGTFTFTDADLSTINGIGGTLQAKGEFSGDLTAIGVTGTAEVPNFSLDLGGKPVPLLATFRAVVDGTDGTTSLPLVDAKMVDTPMIVSGAITNLAGPGNRQVDLNVTIADGRVEDLLALVLDAPRPVMTGDVRLDVKLALPPGPGRVRHRLRIAGTFGLASTTFTAAGVQAKLQELSRRSQGKDEDDAIARVLTNLNGRFALSDGVVTLQGLRFVVPGARVSLAGTYAVVSGALDLRGTLVMQASLSEAVGGFKSILIRPFDRMFRKGSTGAALPIKIAGTREKPTFGLDMGRVLKKN